MKPKRLLLAWLLACLLPLTSMADVWQDPETKVNYEYTPGNGVAGVCAYNNVEGDITILSKFTLDGVEYNVTYMARGAFQNCNRLTGINIPKPLDDLNFISNYISFYAFQGCSALTKVLLPEGVWGVGDYAFYGTSSLKEIEFPQSLENISFHAFSGSGLESVVIPDSITWFGRYCFSNCNNLKQITLPAVYDFQTDWGARGYCRNFENCTALEEVICRSTTPPKIVDNPFAGVDLSKVILYVPLGTKNEYENKSPWNQFQSIIETEKLDFNSNEVSVLEVNLPDGTDVNTYKDMFIELVNIESGQKQHYVITNRLTYTFNSLAHGSSYNVYLKNRQGDVLGKIEGIDIVDEDVSVTFPSLLVPKDVTLRVFTPQRQDVTEQATITWFDQKDTYLSRGLQLTGQIEGAKVMFRIQLPQALGMEYLLPQDSLYEVQSANEIDYTLAPIPQTTISGKVCDAKTGMALNGATVTASQMLNGLYSKAFTTKTDNQGKWSLTVFEAKTDITASMADYVSKSLSIDTLTTEIPAFELMEINGTVISLNLTYTSTGGETQPFYSDYANVAYTVYNETTKQAVEELSVQYPQIVLMDELEQGTNLRITAMSKNAKFLPITTEATVDSLSRAEVTLPIVQLGGIMATFKQTDNTSVVGILYDQGGRFIKKYDYGSASLTIDELTDGDYTLVTMANSQFFNSVATVSQFSEVGLKEGVDYVKNQVSVKSGAYTAIENQLIPYLDESKLYYTGENTSVSVNKSQITVGNYLTISSRIDFKDEYANAVKDVRLIVDLPEACSFVQNSVMAGTSTASYTYADNRLTIPLANYSDRVRFCFIPTAGGSYALTASVQFTLNGKEITQPIGNANFTAKDLSINVPSTIAMTTVPVSGTAVGKSKVEIYDNDVLVGQTESLANGFWTTTIELTDCYNLSSHEIYAKTTTTQDLELYSETQETTYDMNAIQVSKVTMYYSNPELHQNYELVYDFQNPSTTPHRYTYYIYNRLFTFTIDFTNNDTTKVSNVVLYVKTGDGKWHVLDTQFDNDKGKWIASGEFGNMYDGIVPVNVSVGYDIDTEIVLDESFISQIFVDSEVIRQEILDKNEIDELVEAFQAAQEEDNTGLMDEIISQLIEIQGGGNDYGSILDEETRLALELEADIMNDSLQIVFNNLFEGSIYLNDVTKEYIDGITIEHALGLSVEKLIEDGFEPMEKTDGSVFYYHYSGDGWQFVDFSDDLYISYNPTAALSRYFGKGNDNDYGLERIKKLCETIDSWGKKISNIFNDNFKKIAEATVTNEKLLKDAQDQLRFLKNFEPRTDEIVTQIIQTEGKIAKYTFRIQLYGRLSKWLEKTVKPLLTQSSKAGKIVGKSFSIFSLISDSWECYNNLKKLTDLRESIKLECIWHLEDAEPHIQLRTDIYSWIIDARQYYTIKIGADIASLTGIFGGLATFLPSGGTSSSVVGVSILAIAANIGISAFFNWRLNKAYAKFVARKRNLPNLCGYDESDNNAYENSGSTESGYPDNDVPIDPSGFVYEAIPSNRLQGVTATAYYKETVEDMYGDLHENVVLWDAAEYAQDNPLFTDENGMYRWDVPQGLWQVKFEKEGYQTTYSEWLPVPPPQLDVNIPMMQMLQPTVISGKAYADGVEFAFDKYMDPATLTSDNIKVAKNGATINGTIVLLNEEATSEGQQQTYASKVRFEVPKGEELLTTDKVQLTVRKAVESYAGVQMENDFSQQFDVELHVRRIATDSLVNVAYGGQRTIKVGALPADAAKGKKMTVKTFSGMIATTSAEVLTLDENGEAELTINGELPGSTAVTFAIEDTDVEAQMIVNVKTASNMVAVAPVASRISGTEVYRGTEIRLSTETENAIIYYTLDGTCPCDKETAIRYNPDEPIIIATDNVVIKAMATAHDLGDSEVKAFRYSLKKTTLGWQMPKGWTWISHNTDEAIPITVFQTNAERIVGQDAEVDIAGGMNGNLTTLQPNQTFKLKVTEPTEYRFSGYEFNAAANPTRVEVGWNWIGYPLNQTMTLDEALLFSSPSDGDCIVGQDGFAEYVEGEWRGTLHFLVPGLGYLYKSAVRNELLFNTTFVSTASSRMKKRVQTNSVWSADSHAYPDIMPLTACLYDNGMKTDASDFLIAAFAGEECRGVSQSIDGCMMVSIYGNGNEQLSFKAIDLQTGKVYNVKETLTFVADNKGSWNIPYTLTLGDVFNGIEELYSDCSELSVTPRVVHDYVSVSVKGRQISQLSIYNMKGQAVLEHRHRGSYSKIDMSKMPQGVYVLSVIADGMTFYGKIQKK